MCGIRRSLNSSTCYGNRFRSRLHPAGATSTYWKPRCGNNRSAAYHLYFKSGSGFWVLHAYCITTPRQTRRHSGRRKLRGMRESPLPSRRSHTWSNHGSFYISELCTWSHSTKRRRYARSARPRRRNCRVRRRASKSRGNCSNMRRVNYYRLMTKVKARPPSHYSFSRTHVLSRSRSSANSRAGLTGKRGHCSYAARP